MQAEFQKLLAADDAAQEEVDKLLKDNSRWAAAGSALSEEEVQLRIRSRFLGTRAGYEQFLTRHPNHIPALLAYGSLLNDLGDDPAAAEQWEKARKLAPENPATWNNLANFYAANGAAPKAFSYFEKAIALTGTNSTTYQRNLGQAIIHLRTNAMAYYTISEQAVLEKGYQLLREAEKKDPDDFALATEIGQTLYALKPLRSDELLAAWKHALAVAGDDVERQGVQLHLARAHLLAARTNEAAQALSGVTNAFYARLRHELERELGKVPPQTSAPAMNPTAPALRLNP